MIFKSITIQNFLSIRDVTLNLQDRGLVLIKGLNRDNPDLNNNGAGKSSMIEALVYALYGRTLRGLKGDAVVHNIPGKNMKIFLDIIDDDGTPYRIARYRKHSTNKNKSFLFRDGVDITPKSEQDFNDYIVNLLQADYTAFTASLLYSGESFKFTSATDSEMKKTFDVMLGLDVLTSCLDITKSELKQLDTELSTTEWKRDDLEKKLELLVEREEKLNEDIETYKEEQIKKVKILQEQVEKHTDDILLKKKELISLEQQQKEQELKQKSLESQLNLCNSKLESYTELHIALQEIKDEIAEKTRNIKMLERGSKDLSEIVESYEEEIELFHNKIKNLKIKKEELLDTVGTPCPTCGSPLVEESILPAQQEYDKKIDTIDSKIKLKKKKIEDLFNDIENNSVSIKELKEELSELNKSSDEFEKLLSTSSKLHKDKAKYESLIQSSNKELYKIKSEVTEKELEIKHTAALIETCNKAIEQSKVEENPYENTLESLKTEQIECNKEIQNYEEMITKKTEERVCLMFWQQAYSNQGIKSLVLDSITPFLNTRVNKYLTKLTSGHIEVKFNTQTTLKNGARKEKFSIEVTNKDGGNDYALNSGGERKRIDLCINLALQDLVASRSNKKFEIAIFDEVLDALDETGVERVMELLQEISSEKSSIFVVSHNEHLKSYFSNIITIEKKDGFSRLIEEHKD